VRLIRRKEMSSGDFGATGHHAKWTVTLRYEADDAQENSN
jgi:hypothetical protein